MIKSIQFLHQAVQRVSARPFGVGAGGRDKKTVSRGHKNNGLPVCAGLRRVVQTKTTAAIRIAAAHDPAGVVHPGIGGAYSNK